MNFSFPSQEVFVYAYLNGIYSVIFKKIMNENDRTIIAENINKYLKKILRVMSKNKMIDW